MLLILKSVLLRRREKYTPFNFFPDTYSISRIRRTRSFSFLDLFDEISGIIWNLFQEAYFRSLTDRVGNNSVAGILSNEWREGEGTFGRDTAASCRVTRSTRPVLRSARVPSRHCSSPHTSSKPVSLIIGGPPRTSRCSLARHVPFSRLSRSAIDRGEEGR